MHFMPNALFQYPMMMTTFVMTVVLSTLSPSYGQSGSGQSGGAFSKQSPLEFSADNDMEWDADKQILNASGNVVLQQGKNSIKADKITVQYGKNQTLKHIHAETTVTVKTPDYTLSGQKLTYTIDDETAKMCGGAKLVMNENLLQGECISYNAKTQKTKISGKAKKQITAIFHTQKKN